MAISDRPDWHDNDEEILVFQEDYPDVYDLVLKVLDGNCSDATLQAFEDDYDKDILENLLKILTGKASEKDIQECRDDFGDEIYNAIVKMMQKKAGENIVDKLQKDENYFIRYLREDVPDVYGFVLQQIVGIHDEKAAGKLRVDYGDAFYHDLMRVINGREDDGVIERFKKEYQEDVYIAIKKMLVLKPKSVSDEVAEASPWKVNSVILNEYVVERELGQGGMGTVYLVAKRASDGARFAVKTLLSSVLKDEDRKRQFMQELRTWIELPEHPHITACRFFRTVDDRLAIFAEYIDGGTLHDWIRRRKLTSLENILDAAIQTAWGLEAAHTQGVIHQDMKPSNVLMTKDGTAKITDFGLARARNNVGVDRLMRDRPNILVSFLGMTEAYCSPEQAERKKLTHKTDIWSWGLSVFEMFNGSVTWGHGNIAMYALEEYIKSKPTPDLPGMPESVAAVLRRCFANEPLKRWDSLGDVAQKLIEIYRKEICREYNRKKPGIKSGKGSEDITHDRRTTYGAEWHDPKVWLAKALKLSGRDQSELEALLKEQKGSRKAQALLDLEVYELALSLYSSLIEQGRKDLQKSLAFLLCNKALVHENVGDVPGAIAMSDKAIQIYERLVNKEGMTELSDDLAMVYSNKAFTVGNLGDIRSAVELFDKAIQIYERLVNKEGMTERSNDLADVYINKAVAVGNLGENRSAVELYDKAIQIKERLVNEEGKTEFLNELATVYRNKAAAVSHLGENRSAVELYDKAIQIYERLVKKEGKTELLIGLASVYFYKAAAVSNLGENRSAVELFDKAIQIYERLVNKEGKTERSNVLADVYMNKAVALGNLGDNRSAVELFDKAIQIYERLVNREGMAEHSGDLARIKIYKADVLHTLGETQKAREEFQQALPVLRKEVQRSGRANLVSVLKWAEIKLKHLM